MTSHFIRKDVVRWGQMRLLSALGRVSHAAPVCRNPDLCDAAGLRGLARVHLRAPLGVAVGAGMSLASRLPFWWRERAASSRLVGSF